MLNHATSLYPFLHYRASKNVEDVLVKRPPPARLRSCCGRRPVGCPSSLHFCLTPWEARAPQASWHLALPPLSISRSSKKLEFDQIFKLNGLVQLPRAATAEYRRSPPSFHHTPHNRMHVHTWKAAGRARWWRQAACAGGAVSWCFPLFQVGI